MPCAPDAQYGGAGGEQPGGLEEIMDVLRLECLKSKYPRDTEQRSWGGKGSGKDV